MADQDLDLRGGPGSVFFLTQDREGGVGVPWAPHLDLPLTFPHQDGCKFLITISAMTTKPASCIRLSKYIIEDSNKNCGLSRQGFPGGFAAHLAASPLCVLML